MAALVERIIMERLERATNLLEISVNKQDDLLVLDCNDITVFSRFVHLYENIDKMSESAKKEMEEVKQKFKGIEDDVNPAQLMAYINVHVMTSQKIMEELDKVFGENFCRKVFRENYELNPDFVPDEIALAELVDSLVPIMEKACGERIKRTQNKYNAGKRGKHTKTKDELIQEFKESRHE